VSHLHALLLFGTLSNACKFTKTHGEVVEIKVSLVQPAKPADSSTSDMHQSIGAFVPLGIYVLTLCVCMSNNM